MDENWKRRGKFLFTAKFPVFNAEYLIEDSFDYPISFNGKMRFKANLSLSLGRAEVQKEIENMELTKKWLDGKTPKKVIVVPGKIVNIVV